MRLRAIRDLAQLSDKDFFSEVSIGLAHVFNNAIRLEHNAKLLGENKQVNGFRVLLGMADEEAAKFLILLDAVRCPRNSSQDKKGFSRQLGRFNDHLAKGIYAEACKGHPATFSELANFIERERQEFYLDGPSDVDWIFWNRILEHRERTIYVDYADTDEGHMWVTPFEFEDDFWLMQTSSVLPLVQALYTSGLTTPEALSLIAKLWRPVQMTPDFAWTVLRDINSKTLKELKAHNLLRQQPQDIYETIVDAWLFPMYALDLELATVDEAKLRQIQREWTPNWESL